MTVHEHQWTYLGDLIMEYSARQLRNEDPDTRRTEYCIQCGTVRIRMSAMAWATIESSCTKEFLTQFTRDTSIIVKNPPIELALIRPTKQRGRLGRGLRDIPTVVGVYDPFRKPEEDN